VEGSNSIYRTSVDHGDSLNALEKREFSCAWQPNHDPLVVQPIAWSPSHNPGSSLLVTGTLNVTEVTLIRCKLLQCLVIFYSHICPSVHILWDTFHTF